MNAGKILLQLFYFYFIFSWKSVYLYVCMYVCAVFFFYLVFTYLLENLFTLMSLWWWWFRWMSDSSFQLVPSGSVYTISFCINSSNLYVCVMFTKVSNELFSRMSVQSRPHKRLHTQRFWHVFSKLLYAVHRHKVKSYVSAIPHTKLIKSLPQCKSEKTKCLGRYMGP